MGPGCGGRRQRRAHAPLRAGVGTRHYYRRFGYYLEGPYMVKMLTEAEHAAPDAQLSAEQAAEVCSADDFQFDMGGWD